MKPWQDKIRKVVPYTPGEQPNRPDMIKLNTNENPYPPAPGVRRILDEFDENSLRLYPDPAASVLVKALADRYGVAADSVFVGVGSDDVLATAFMTFFNSDRPILFPDITYSFYPVWAGLFKIPYKVMPLMDDFSINREDYYQENGGVIFPNPNAPTSKYESLDLIEDILKANRDVIVIIDEAYIDFGGESALALTGRYDNLLVVQTFSKSRSMAGMRIGFAIGNKELIKYLSDVKFSINSYTMNQPAIAGGIANIEDEAYFREIVSKVIKSRERAKNELIKLGFNCLDSSTNFLFASHREKRAEDIFEYLKSRNIYVRYFKKPRIDNHLRISIGTDEQMDKLILALKGFLLQTSKV